MRLNNNCLRDILLYLESCDYYILNDNNDVESNGIWFEKICKENAQYSKPEIYYSLSNLEQAGFINMSKSSFSNSLDCCVNFITFQGHEFLNQIKDDKNWSKIQHCLKALRNYSLDAIQSVASGIASAAIQSYTSSISSKNV